ncbi:hypothetical protein QFZ64_000125 [Streptomyces sp. B3I8]|jgi:hypothetical protein|nr:hypothetical protein [Streptomyces sp. B3I8]
MPIGADELRALLVALPMSPGNRKLVQCQGNAGRTSSGEIVISAPKGSVIRRVQGEPQTVLG